MARGVKVAPREQRSRVTIRRDLNDLVRDANGRVSSAKVGMNTGQLIAAYLLLKHSQFIIDRWDALAILLTILVAPDMFKKFINLKYGAPK